MEPLLSLTANYFTHNLPATLTFYAKLGFTQVAAVPEVAPFNWVMLVNGPVTIMLQTFDSLGTELPEISRNPGGSLLLYIKLKNITDFFDKIKSDVPVLKGLDKTFYGATEFSILDPNGYVLTFAEDENE